MVGHIGDLHTAQSWPNDGTRVTLARDLTSDSANLQIITGKTRQSSALDDIAATGGYSPLKYVPCTNNCKLYTLRKGECVVVTVTIMLRYV